MIKILIKFYLVHMEIEAYINKKKEIYLSLLCFIEATDNVDIHFQSLIEVLNKQNVLQEKRKTQELLILISKIVTYHHLTPDLISNFEMILKYIINNIKESISTEEIFQIFRPNKRFLFLLFDKQILTPDERTIKIILKHSNSHFVCNRHYFFRAIKPFLSKEDVTKIEKEIPEKYDKDIQSFENQCFEGTNESYICSLIRQDLVEEFIKFVNRTNLSLLSTIKPSIYETDIFLMGKYLTLIEYAAFYGSIQIFQYLLLNQVKLTESLWTCAIHSNNAEMIHLLETNLKLKENEYDDILKESIKCHHNDICDYIKDNLMEPTVENRLKWKFDNCICESYNYYFYPNDISYIIEKPRNSKGFNISNLIQKFTSLTIPSL